MRIPVQHFVPHDKPFSLQLHDMSHINRIITIGNM
jgi:hypothetical protein